jgi:drug/metabolite transporter (DMT)-like permease
LPTVPDVRTIVCLAILVMAGTAGDLALACAMKCVGHVDLSPACVIRGIIGGFRQLWLWIGVMLHMAAFVSFLALLSWADVSVVVPASALSYIAGVAGAKLFLREQIDHERWVGVLLIAVGVALVLAG